MSDSYAWRLLHEVDATALYLNRMVYGLNIAPDDPLLTAYTDLLEWRARAKWGRATYIEGFRLWQEALEQIEVERLIYGADSAGEVAA